MLFSTVFLFTFYLLVHVPCMLKSRHDSGDNCASVLMLIPHQFLKYSDGGCQNWVTCTAPWKVQNCIEAMMAPSLADTRLGAFCFSLRGSCPNWPTNLEANRMFKTVAKEDCIGWDGWCQFCLRKVGWGIGYFGQVNFEGLFTRLRWLLSVDTRKLIRMKFE